MNQFSLEKEFKNFSEILRWRGVHQPDKTAYIFLEESQKQQAQITYSDLDVRARAIARCLQDLNAKGERALLLYPSGLEFISAFFGSLYSSVIAVPAYPPDPFRLNRTLPRLISIAADSDAKFILTTHEILKMAEPLVEMAPELKKIKWIATDQISSKMAEKYHDIKISEDDLAFLQYTSGSTTHPKGVMISHKNLLSNQAMIQHAFEHSQSSVVVGWLPLYHDMGLIGNILQPLYLGAKCILMSPHAFLKNPYLWLETISHYKATTSGAPNFAYDLCVRKIGHEQRDRLNLSRWDLAFCGAEPIRAETLEKFSKYFAPSGFRSETFYPCYGLAEATLIVSGGKKKKAWEKYFHENENLKSLVGCGKSLLDQKIEVVNGEAIKCSPGQIGEIWVSGSNVAQGYWNKTEISNEIFQAKIKGNGDEPYLRTGDLGFIQGDELYVTGRIKDLIIINGRNHYPHDIELTVEKVHPVFRPGCIAAFSVDDTGEEKLVVIAEIDQRKNTDKISFDELIITIKAEIAKYHDLSLFCFKILETGSIPKTSSGKIQRYLCKQNYYSNKLSEVYSWSSKNFQSSFEYSPKNQNLESKEKAKDTIDWLRSYADERINSRLIDERRCIPPHIVLDFGNHGLLGLEVPKTYGGSGLRMTDTLSIVEQLAAIDLTLALFVGVHNSLGVRPILKFSHPRLREKILPSIASGRELVAFALTEPSAGSNPRGITSKAVKDLQGGWKLNGEKIYIGSGSWASYLNIFAKTEDEGGENSQFNGFVVTQGSKGFKNGPEALTMGVRGMVQNAIHFEDVSLPEESLLGKPGMGFEVAQDAMMFGRLGLGAISVGGMKRCAQLILRYADRRSISTGKLLDHPLTLARLNELTSAITAVELLVKNIARLHDENKTVPAFAFAACKIVGPELLWKAADDLVQFLGGRGYTENNIAPQILRDARLLRIFEGPTETLEMYLGSSAIHQDVALFQFINQELGSFESSEKLKEIAEEIKNLCLKEQGNDSHKLQWAYILAGQVTSWIILHSVLQKENKKSSSSYLVKALAWTQEKLDYAIQNALKMASGKSPDSTQASSTNLIASYAETIGDIEQSLAGEDYDLDKYLKKNEPQSPPTNISLVSSSSLEKMETKHPADVELQTAIVHQSTIQNWILQWLHQNLGIEITQIDTHKSFADYGMTSLTAGMFCGDLEKWMNYSIPTTILWECPNVEKLTQYLTQLSYNLNKLTSGEEASVFSEDSVPLIHEIEKLSEEEVSRLLNHEQSSYE